ncbi:hypothetical protein LX32DRAFT_77007 [Colletotrichum zoysiae]|uniref:Uncharacterized protein n=1 Tax=Colletotrichum zoysiae TaxID=1216348 RepID=A0AAD9HAZ5_9PEZI|nr:hypothetical protein LX32DRAFT_77007 [Colletotrichum zoysiae]
MSICPSRPLHPSQHCDVPLLPHYLCAGSLPGSETDQPGYISVHTYVQHAHLHSHTVSHIGVGSIAVTKDILIGFFLSRLCGTDLQSRPRPPPLAALCPVIPSRYSLPFGPLTVGLCCLCFKGRLLFPHRIVAIPSQRGRGDLTARRRCLEAPRVSSEQTYINTSYSQEGRPIWRWTGLLLEPAPPLLHPRYYIVRILLCTH